MEGKSINYEERYKIEKKLDKKGIKNYKAFKFYFLFCHLNFSFFLFP